MIFEFSVYAKFNAIRNVFWVNVGLKITKYNDQAAQPRRVSTLITNSCIHNLRSNSACSRSVYTVEVKTALILSLEFEQRDKLTKYGKQAGEAVMNPPFNFTSNITACGKNFKNKSVKL